MRTLSIALSCWVGCVSLADAAPLKVVATLSTFADLVETVGGDRVEVTHIASPKFNPHFIDPKPSDVLNVKRADLFVHAGLDLELWRFPLVDAAGNARARPGGDGELDLSQGIRLLEVPQDNVSRAEGDIHMFGNPHYWTNPENAKVMARSIAKKLSELDPAGAAGFEERAQAFLDRVDRKIPQWRERIEAAGVKEVVAYHNSWPYLMEFLGLKLDQFVEPKPGVPPSPRHLDFMTNYIKEQDIPVIIQSQYFSLRKTKMLAKRTNATIAPLVQNVAESKETSDYVAMVEYNVETVSRACEAHAKGD
ncbi:MAG: metal ABC transporter substrate-binding protein [Candidatus Hydrogenedentes bacterium]|nr:metal ABC transporter substrate-binding protein [Candidatus Hydrogenedentota bacterium]